MYEDKAGAIAAAQHGALLVPRQPVLGSHAGTFPPICRASFEEPTSFELARLGSTFDCRPFASGGNQGEFFQPNSHSLDGHTELLGE